MEKTENSEKLGAQRAFCPMRYKSAEKCKYLAGNECQIWWAPVDSAKEEPEKKPEENGDWKICCFK